MGEGIKPRIITSQNWSSLTPRRVLTVPACAALVAEPTSQIYSLGSGAGPHEPAWRKRGGGGHGQLLAPLFPTSQKLVHFPWKEKPLQLSCNKVF